MRSKSDKQIAFQEGTQRMELRVSVCPSDGSPANPAHLGPYKGLQAAMAGETCPLGRKTSSKQAVITQFLVFYKARIETSNVKGLLKQISGEDTIFLANMRLIQPYQCTAIKLSCSQMRLFCKHKKPW